MNEPLSSNPPVDPLLTRLAILKFDQPTNKQRGTIQDAIDEIERLTAELADLGNPKAGVGYWIDECNKARAERDRLRGALAKLTSETYAEMVARGDPSVTCTCPDVCKVCGGMVAACNALGHREPKDRHVQWHTCPTPHDLNRLGDCRHPKCVYPAIGYMDRTHCPIGPEHDK